jgi:GntR family transcriptional regulator
VALEFRVATGSNTPIHRQIADQIRIAVASGALETGEQLPSLRALAELLVINPNTVARVYGDLVKEGVLQSHPGRGLFVAPRVQKFSEQDRRRRLEEALDAFLTQVVFLDFSPAEVAEMVHQKLTELTGGALETSEQATLSDPQPEAQDRGESWLKTSSKRTG